MNGFERLSAQARDYLDAVPRPSTEDVAFAMAWEMAKEFGVPQHHIADFIDRIMPALTHIISAERAKLMRLLEERAVLPYLARPVPPLGGPAIRAPTATDHTLAPQGTIGDHRTGGSQSAPVAHRDLGLGVQTRTDSHTGAGPSTPGPDGHDADESHDDVAVHLESANFGQSASDSHAGDAEDADDSGASSSMELSAAEVLAAMDQGGSPRRHTTANDHSVALPTPLSLRMSVFAGWRALQDEVLFVPEEPKDSVTYGTATVRQLDKAIGYQHSMASARIAKAKRLQVLRQTLVEAGVVCLNDLLNGRRLAGGDL